MDFTIINHGRALLYERKHPVIVKYVQPAIVFVIAVVCFLGLFVIEGIAISVGLLGVAWVALQFI